MIRGRGDEGITMCGKKKHVNKGAETSRAGGEEDCRQSRRGKKTPDCQSVTEELEVVSRGTTGEKSEREREERSQLGKQHP